MLAGFFERDINAFLKELRAIPESQLWVAPGGVSNSAGMLAQHLAGNLNHFIGHGLGATGYVRDRDSEFTNTGRSGAELALALESARNTVAEVLPRLDESLLEGPFPIPVRFQLNTFGVLLQLHHHLSYHLGQINYLRRMMAGG